MTSTVVAVVVVAILAGATLTSPTFRARLAVWRDIRAEADNSRDKRRAPGRSADAYHEFLQATIADIEDGDHYIVNARTWIDLNLDNVFERLDHTRSRVGQQYLRRLLRMPCLQAGPISRLDREVSRLTTEPESARQVRGAFAEADDPRASHLVELLFGVLPDRPRLWWAFPLLPLAEVLLLGSMLVWPRAFIGLLAVLIVNICIQLLYRPRVEALIPAIHEIPAFLQTSRRLSELDRTGFDDEREILRTGVDALEGLRSATRWLRLEPNQEANELRASLYLYANLLLLLDVNAFVFAIATAHKCRSVLQRMFAAMGYIDAVQSIAAFRDGVAPWCSPQFSPRTKSLDVNGVVHPLVASAVPNNLTLSNSSLLITGSNMSGKTTLVRALGVNAILAQSVSTALAERWHTPMLRVCSSIGRSDSLLEGKSYYLAEVESVRTLIKAKDSGAQHLFLLDELFRGTNTAERIAGGYAVLEYLDRGDDLVVVATHDTELLGLLDGRYSAKHFREHISAHDISFDFIMRDGPGTTRSAIALLELMQYPAELIDNARRALR